MNKKLFLLLVIGGLLVSCGGRSEEVEDSSSIDEQSSVAIEPSEDPSEDSSAVEDSSEVIPETDPKLKFVVTIPDITPVSDPLHIAGTLSAFGLTDWDPGQEGAKLTRIDGKYLLEFSLTDDLTYPINLQYKYTRGDWGKVEKGSQGEELSNRTLTITDNTKSVIQEDIVVNWADLSTDTSPSTVVGNLDIIDLSDERFPDATQVTRKVRIWTPANYDPNANTTYPVIYMHDGQNVFDRKTAFAGEWEADETVEKLISDYPAFEGAIVVGVDNSPQRMGEYVYDHPFLTSAQASIPKTGQHYMNFIVDVVKPYVDANYKTKLDRKNTHLAGSSLGGLISLFGGLEHLDTFGSILAFSTSTQLVDSDEAVKTYFASVDQALLKDTLFYLYVGSSNDGNVNWPSNYEALLLELGVPASNIETKVGMGYQHNELAWRTHLPESLKWVFNLV